LVVFFVVFFAFALAPGTLRVERSEPLDLASAKAP
jgi:hypothetical protein